MKKIINNPDNILEEVLDGYINAYPQYVEKIMNFPIVVRRNKKSNKVALVSGGGSGHEPAHFQYVGEGMLDAAVCGEIFTSPSADKVFEAIQTVDAGKGVLLIIKNYSGDVMNFEMAAEMAIANGIEVKKVIVDDDIAVENSTYTVGRRGVAGTIFVHKILGAAAEKGYSLDELEKLGSKLVKNIKTIGMAIKPCFVPTSQKLSFELDEGEIEMGVGIHGEPGTHRSKTQTANEYVDYMVNKLLEEIKVDQEEIAVMINGLGGTTSIELFIVNQRVNHILKTKNSKIIETFVGNYMTSLDMEGFSITICKLDDETKELLQSRANTPFLKM